MIAIIVGVLVLQGAFYEHIQLLKRASAPQWKIIKVRTPQELERCDGLIIPGVESTVRQCR